MSCLFECLLPPDEYIIVWMGPRQDRNAPQADGPDIQHAGYIHTYTRRALAIQDCR
jgi:hypothetical protein